MSPTSEWLTIKLVDCLGKASNYRGSQYEHILYLCFTINTLSLPLARQSSSDATDISEVDSRPLGVYLLK